MNSGGISKKFERENSQVNDTMIYFLILVL